MQYMTKSVAIRLDEDLVSSAKEASRAAGESFTAYVAGALRLRLNGTVSILTSAMEPRAELPLEPPAVPRPPLVLAAVCSHSATKTTGPFSAPVRTCLRCGEVRP